MPGHCLYCYAETGTYEVGYHVACAKKMFGQYPPPLIPFTAEQLQKVIKSQPEFIIERKKKGAEQARVIPAKTGLFEIRTMQAKPLYLPEAEGLCLKMAALVGIDRAAPVAACLPNILATDDSRPLVPAATPRIAPAAILPPLALS